MRARPNLAGEQMVTDYLTRVAQAARLLPKGQRAAFVGRMRALVDRELGPPGNRTDPVRVNEVLTRLGTPEDLVIAERTRIDQRWVKGRAATKEEGEAAAAALTGPRNNRPLTARRRPNSDTQPLYGRSVQPGTDETVIGPDGSITGAPPGRPGTGQRRSILRGAGPRGAGGRVAGLRVPGPRTAGSTRNPGSPGTASPGTAGTGFPDASGSPGTAPSGTAPGAGPRSPGPRRLRSADAPDSGPQAATPRGRRQPEAPGAGTQATEHTGPVGWLIGQVPGKRRAGGAGTLAATAAQLARDNLLEALAVLLLGLGGLILPQAFWPVGAIVTMFSRIWDIRDKTLAVTGPLLVTLVAAVPAAVFVGGSGNVIVVYFHGLHVSFLLMLRVGCVLTAAYLARRVVKGPRVKTPPWRRVTR